MEKDFQIKLEETTLTVNLGVELSKINAPALIQLLSTYQGQDIRKIVFDATDLVFISSAGIRCIIFARKDLGEKPEIKSIREGEVPGTHTVTLTSEVDSLTLRHEAFSREGLARGAVVAALLTEGLQGVHAFDELI